MCRSVTEEATSRRVEAADSGDGGGIFFEEAPQVALIHGTPEALLPLKRLAQPVGNPFRRPPVLFVAQDLEGKNCTAGPQLKKHMDKCVGELFQAVVGSMTSEDPYDFEVSIVIFPRLNS